MNWNAILELVVTVLKTPAVITLLAAGLAWLLAKGYLARPEWQKYRGYIISAVKLAEKEIPDDTPNAGLAKADWALKYVLTIYEQATGKAADAKLTASIAQGIPVVHAELEANLGLG